MRLKLAETGGNASRLNQLKHTNMKKLIELGHTQATIMDKILKEEWLYKPKLASKFTIEHIAIDEDYTKHYLSYSGNKLDSTFFGCLMYRLGMEAQKEYTKG